MAADRAEGDPRLTGSSGNPQTPSFLLHYLGLFRRRIWVILPCFVILTTMGVVSAVRAPVIFQAAATLLVERSTPALMDFQDRFRETDSWDPDFYQTQAQLLCSRSVMEVALDDERVRALFEVAPATEDTAPRRGSWVQDVRRTLISALGAEPPPPPEPWEMLRDSIAVTHVADTHFIRVSVMSGDRHRAALIANAAAEGFVRYHVRKREDVLGDAYEGLEKERVRQEQKMLEAEKALQAFRSTTEVVSVDVDKQDQPAVDRLIRLNEQLTDVQLERIKLSSEIDVMKSVAGADGALSEASEGQLFSLPVIQENETLVQGRQDLAAAAKDLAVLAETYAADHPLLQAARSKVELLTEQFKMALDEVVSSHVNRLTMLQNEEVELQKEYGKQKQVAVELAKESFTFMQLRAEVERHRRLFEEILERMREVDISSGLIKTSVDLVEAAAVPKMSLNRGKFRSVLFAGFAGLFLGIGLAFLFENLDDTVKTPEDLKERLGVPLLGFVPAIAPEEKRAGAQEMTATAAQPGAQPGEPHRESGGGDESPGTPLRRAAIVLAEPASSPAEAYRSVRTNLFYATPADEIKVLALTSCRPQEGKTTTSTNLSLSIAQSGKRTLLIDADLHRPTTQKVLGVELREGLTSVLVGECHWKEALSSVMGPDGKPVEDLDLMGAGPQSPNPSELLGSRKMRELVAELREEYDWVLIDTPPVLFVSDSSIVSTLCDGVIMVVKAGSCSRTLLSRAKDQLLGVKAHIIGSVLNNMVVSRVGRHYSDYYHHGYSRYAKDYHRSYYGDGDEGRDDSDPSDEA